MSFGRYGRDLLHRHRHRQLEAELAGQLTTTPVRQRRSTPGEGGCGDMFGILTLRSNVLNFPGIFNTLLG
jgi:hypothetical protein